MYFFIASRKFSVHCILWCEHSAKPWAPTYMHTCLISILKGSTYSNPWEMEMFTYILHSIYYKMYVISDPGAERHLVSFVVRDSPMGFVAVTCWGTEKYIAEISNLYHVGDIGITKLFRILIPTAYRSEQTFLEGGDQWYSGWTNQNLTLGCWMWMFSRPPIDCNKKGGKKKTNTCMTISMFIVKDIQRYK